MRRPSTRRAYRCCIASTSPFPAVLSGMERRSVRSVTAHTSPAARTCSLDKIASESPDLWVTRPEMSTSPFSTASPFFTIFLPRFAPISNITPSRSATTSAGMVKSSIFGFLGDSRTTTSARTPLMLMDKNPTSSSSNSARFTSSRSLTEGP